MELPQGGQLQRKVQIKWSSNFAYAIGLITSDGNLSSNKKKIGFVSKDLELIQKFKIALRITSKIHKYPRGQKPFKKYYNITIGDKVFYQFLNTIGLKSAKSKTIKFVRIPDQYFADFLRGLFDGDGTFYYYWDKRWPNSFGFKLSFISASIQFINWLKKKLTQAYKVKGYLHPGKGVVNLEYVKGDSKRIFAAMYYRNAPLFLNRKYRKLEKAITQDRKFGLEALQKQRHAAVAHW